MRLYIVFLPLAYFIIIAICTNVIDKITRFDSLIQKIYGLYFVQLLLLLLGGITERINDAGYCDRCECSVVCLSVCLSVTLEHLAKPLGGMKCHFAATIMGPEVTTY